jgi:DNA cross-link repair 1A protein
MPPFKRFQRAAIAKPGQENPFGLGAIGAKGSSAFSTIMSSHAEDAAWATAAASETASRGKPAYQRTCPFYKILPGFSICVDAFRYGAVEGCKAYFLSHFHSDHYIGLTSSWCHGPIYCSHVTANLVRRQLRVDPKWVVDLEFDDKSEVPGTGGVEVTMIPANHCPGSSLYLFEKVVGKGPAPKVQRVLHCGDFRACPAHVKHPRLRPDIIDAVTGRNIGQQKLDVCYLDTTYLTPKYAFPSQEDVIQACADMCVSLSKDIIDANDSWEKTKRERAGSGMVKFVRGDSDSVPAKDEEDTESRKAGSKREGNARGRLLVIVGTYSIGKERICLGIARALNSKIYAPPHKQKICAALEDPELTARLTSDPLDAQVHMQMLMEIRAETLADYLTTFKPHFSRIVGFRPSGWNYRPPQSRFVESPAVPTVLHSDHWKSRYTMAELVPQRGSTREAQCFGVPYSEHSSFRELTMFCCALRIDKIIPTVNVGSAKSREKMKGWCEKWAMEKKKNGLFPVADGQVAW